MSDPVTGLVFFFFEQLLGDCQATEIDLPSHLSHLSHTTSPIFPLNYQNSLGSMPTQNSPLQVAYKVISSMGKSV